MIGILGKNRLNFFDILVLISCECFIFTYFDLNFLMLKTITTGGDTGSHYYTGVFLKEVLLPQGKIMGWMNANYAGYPLFYHYFPLPFLMMALLAYLIPMQIAFKLITVLGTVLTPIFLYISFRLAKVPKPIPIIASVASLAFLFNEKNSMWGGNIPSTLAGEFSFSLSFSLFCLLLGTFYKGIKERKLLILNGIIIALMVFSHGYTFMLFGLLLPFFLIHRDWPYRFVYVTCAIILGVSLVAFWLFPFFANLPWVTPHRLKWIFGSVWEIFPPVLIPFFVLGVFGIIVGSKNEFVRIYGYLLLVSILGYFISYDLGLADIRFLTFAQFTLTICASFSFYPVVRYRHVVLVCTAIFAFSSFFWVAQHISYIKFWVKWNYSGFELKRDWPQAEEIFGYLKGSGPGRVAYENSALYDRFGTMRVFESMKLFAQRDTLEGLYMQSSITAPFVFYIQSEISKTPSGPFPDYKITNINVDNAKEHLKMFAVTHVIAISPEVKRQMSESSHYELENRIKDIEIFRVKESSPRIVTPALYEPVAYTKKTWKRDFYEWFKDPRYLSIPLVRVEDHLEVSKFKSRADNLSVIPVIPLDKVKGEIRERVSDGIIEFETELLAHPHIIRMSYHPNWKVTGAEKIYHVAPSFMLVYPTQRHVKLEYSKGMWNTIGEMVSICMMIVIIFLHFRKIDIADKIGNLRFVKGNKENLS